MTKSGDPTMNPDTIKELRRLMEEATPGPYLCEDNLVYALSDHAFPVNLFTAYVQRVNGKRGASDGQRAATAQMFAAAINALPQLLAIAEAAQASLDALDRLGSANGKTAADCRIDGDSHGAESCSAASAAYKHAARIIRAATNELSKTKGL